MKTKKWLCRNAHYQAERSTGVAPQPLCLPLNAIPPEPGTSSSLLCAGAVWGDWYRPLRHHTRALYFMANGKGILQSQKRRD
jgi:hypothetical protein